MVGENQDGVGGAEGIGQHLATLIREELVLSAAEVVPLVCHPVEETKAVQVAHLELRVSEARECCCIWHVRMQYCGGIGATPVKRRVDDKRGDLDIEGTSKAAVITR